MKPKSDSCREAACYLDVDEQLQEVSGRHDDGGVERDDVALVQTQIQVCSQPLRQKTNFNRPREQLVFTRQYSLFLFIGKYNVFLSQHMNNASSKTVAFFLYRNGTEIHVFIWNRPASLLMQTQNLLRVELLA